MDERTWEALKVWALEQRSTVGAIVAELVRHAPRTLPIRPATDLISDGMGGLYRTTGAVVSATTPPSASELTYERD